MCDMSFLKIICWAIIFITRLRYNVVVHPFEWSQRFIQQVLATSFPGYFASVVEGQQNGPRISQSILQSDRPCSKSINSPEI